MISVDPKPITVSELNKYMKDKVADDEFLQNVLIKGELSNFKAHYTGHLYFTLKDETSLVKGIMFKSYADNLKFKPQDGMSVIIFGTVSVFERDGVYQIYAKDMMMDGVGALYAQYEKLKKDLEANGLFKQEHKKPIPKYAKNIGVITSQTGSVIRDIINVSTRRNPNVSIKLIPAGVQGPGAKEQIVHAIEKFNELKNVDVIILARGGGSLEDLWPFNEEIVAYAIYNSNIPIISAVGHETDFSISDFVADLRAPTPSAGAELAVADVTETKWKLDTYLNNLKTLLNKKYVESKHRLDRCVSSNVFINPEVMLQNRAQILDSDVKKLEYVIKNIYSNSKEKFVSLSSKLDAISPLKTLERGYSIVSDEKGKILKSIKDVKKEQDISIRFLDGDRKAKILD